MKGKMVQFASKTEVCEDTKLGHCIKLVFNKSGSNGKQQFTAKKQWGNLT